MPTVLHRTIVNQYLLLVGVFLLLSTTVVTGSGLCGYVYDWGTEDVGRQYSTNYISASWAGFEEANDNSNIKSKVRYDWAIVSDDMATNAIRLAATEEDSSSRCRNNSGISGKPDVADWTNVDSTYATNYQLSLTPGQTYYVLLRVSTTTISSDGQVTESVIYTNGAGITISTTTKYTRGKNNDNNDNNNNNKRNKDNNNKNNNKNNKNNNKKNNNNNNPIVLPSLLESSSSSFDFNPALFNSSHSAISVSSGLLGWQIALIIIACVTALILLLVLIFIVVGRVKGDDKYETNVHRNENAEKI